MRVPSELLQVPREDIRPQADNLMMDKKLVIKEERVYASNYYYAELNCARMLHELNIRATDLNKEQVKRKSGSWKKTWRYRWMSCRKRQ